MKGRDYRLKHRALADLVDKLDVMMRSFERVLAERGREYPLGRAALGGLGPELEYQHHSALRRSHQAPPSRARDGLMMR